LQEHYACVHLKLSCLLHVRGSKPTVYLHELYYDSTKDIDETNIRAFVSWTLVPQVRKAKRMLVLVIEPKLKNYSRDYRHGKSTRNNWYNVYGSILLEEASIGVHCGYRNKGSQ
jgi:hypothetical protein